MSPALPALPAIGRCVPCPSPPGRAPGRRGYTRSRRSESVLEITWRFVPASTHKARFGPASPYRARLFVGSGVMVRVSPHQSCEEGAEESFAAAPGVVHELEEAEVKWQLLL